MIRTFKTLSLLLTYPTSEIQSAAPALREAIEREALLDRGSAKELFCLIDELAQRDLYDLQERYVLLFDRSRSLSLHLFEHVHGESRERGQAMVDLMALYERHGLFVDAKELPDFLPLFLEFLATRPLPEARALLAEPIHVVAALRERLHRRKSRYAAVFRALETLADGAADPELLTPLLDAQEDDPEDLEALDDIWEEEMVTFGPGAGMTAPDGGCPAARSALARIDENIAASTQRKEAGHG